MAFSLPDLTYDYDELEPWIDRETMEIHHLKHHKSYLDRFNETIRDTGLEKYSIDKLFEKVSKYPEAVMNQGGGFYNHSLFWRVIGPPGNGKPNGRLAEAINKYFGTIELFKKEFSEASEKFFGSGWAWLVKTVDTGELVISVTPNQVNPLMDVSGIKGRPILCLDLWEHAYYLKYRNRRADYIRAFWNVVNWKEASRIFELY